MKHNRFIQVAALAMAAVLLALLLPVSAVAAATVEDLVSQAAAAYAYTNKSTADDAVAAVEAALADSAFAGQYTVAVENWHLIRAVGGAKDQDGMLWEGYEGHIAGTVVLTSADAAKRVDFTATIAPAITEYTFETVAKQASDFVRLTESNCDFYGVAPVYLELYPECWVASTSDGGFFLVSDGGKLFVTYSGEAEKIVFPEGVEKMVFAEEYEGEDWFIETNTDAVRCMILPSTLTELPDQFAVPFRNSLEVVIMGDKVTTAKGYRTFFQCYYLKTLRLSEKLENLPEEALFQCLSLYDYRLPTGLKVISKGALHLSALRDVYVPTGVEYIGSEAFAWPMRDLQMLNPRPQGNEVPQEVIDELNPAYHAEMWLDITNRNSYIPRSLYILSKDAEYQDNPKSYWNTAWGVQSEVIYYLPDSTTAGLIDSGYTGSSDGSATVKELNMDKNHVTVMLEDVADRLVINANTTEADLLAQFNKLIASTTVTDLSLQRVTVDTRAGKARGEVYGKVNGEDTLLLAFNTGVDAPEDSETTTTTGAVTTPTTAATGGKILGMDVATVAIVAVVVLAAVVGGLLLFKKMRQ